jgi:hypothetical protein
MRIADSTRLVRVASEPGILAVRSLLMRDDPDVYVYEMDQELSRLFLIQGAH